LAATIQKRKEKQGNSDEKIKVTDGSFITSTKELQRIAYFAYLANKKIVFRSLVRI